MWGNSTTVQTHRVTGGPWEGLAAHFPGLKPALQLPATDKAQSWRVQANIPCVWQRERGSEGQGRDQEEKHDVKESEGM
jgi:hypothetical protein